MGLEMVCDEEVTNYETTENDGSTYTWEVDGGTIIEGQGTYIVTVQWGIAGNGTVAVTEQDENGCSATADITVFIDDCTGIENKLLSNDFKIYPNPASSNLNLEFSANRGNKIEISIFNSMGQLVMTKQDIATGENQTSNFNIESLNKGMYIVTIQANKQVIWKSKIDKF